MKQIVALTLVVALAAPALHAQDTGAFFAVRECGRLGFAFGDAAPLRIAAVLPGAPAERAGLRPDDVVIRIDDGEASAERMKAIADTLAPGDVVRLRIRRAGKEHDIAIVASRDVCIRAAAPDMTRAKIVFDSIRAVFATDFDSLLIRSLAIERQLLDSLRWALESAGDAAPIVIRVGSQPRLAANRLVLTEVGLRAVAGAEYTELTPPLARYFQGADEGLLVLRVAPGTPAARAGLEPGDVVTRAGTRAVRSIDDLRDAIARTHPSPVELEVVRHTEKLRLVLPGT